MPVHWSLAVKENYYLNNSIEYWPRLGYFCALAVLWAWLIFNHLQTVFWMFGALCMSCCIKEYLQDGCMLNMCVCVTLWASASARLNFLVPYRMVHDIPVHISYYDRNLSPQWWYSWCVYIHKVAKSKNLTIWHLQQEQARRKDEFQPKMSKKKKRASSEISINIWL